MAYCHLLPYFWEKTTKLVYKIVTDIQIKLIDINNVIRPIAFFNDYPQDNVSEQLFKHEIDLCLKITRSSHWMHWLHSAPFVIHSSHAVVRKELLKPLPPSNYCSCFYPAMRVVREIIYTHTCKVRKTSCFIALI